jgi:peroxiredoxin
MALLNIGAKFPELTVKDIDGDSIDFPSVLKEAPASIVFFYRGQW